MSYVMVDVESDGPCPGLYSMVCFGAVIVEPGKSPRSFYGQLAPISEEWVPEALAISGFTRDQHISFEEPVETMKAFNEWIQNNCDTRPMFISDNNGFDWQFINYYFWAFLNRNPFGFSSTNLGSLYKGCVRDTFKNFKHLRKTKHTHHPVDDCKGNVEAMLQMIKDFNLKISL